MNKYPLLTTLFILLSFNSAHAFTLSTSIGAAFDIEDGREVVMNVEDGGGTCDLGLTPTELLDMAQQAANKFWNRAPTTDLKLVRGSVVNVPGFHDDDLCSPDSPCRPTSTFKHSKEILIGCNENTSNFPASTILGLSVPTRLSGKTIKAASVLLNGSAGSAFLGLDHDQQMAVVAHEIGHALGLGHSPVKDSLMYYQSVPTRVDLGEDDIDGITYLYPKTQVVDMNCGSLLFLGRDNMPKPPRGGFLLLITLALFVGLYKRVRHSA